eukprot:TRINITY_DN6337_c0_g1_i1.p1 TRINITY_DN6337_c0_g1~~TRINITY_DN6337_c0_g1_i1.p1  ORF type:complete len:506 (+),score=96.29 TRINITY_DN6337_c0_g1_i1:35-1552(+)
MIQDHSFDNYHRVMKLRRRSKIIITCLVFLFILGALAIVAGGLLPKLVSNKLNAGIRQMLVVSGTNSDSYNDWLGTDVNGEDVVPMYMNFRFWNLTNPDDFLNGHKPILIEVGPYSYREIKVKYDASFPDNGNKNSFKTWQYFLFEEKMSNGDPMTDLITTINIPFHGVKGTLGSDWLPSLAFTVLASATNSTLLTTRTPNELIWGYDDPFLQFLSNLQPSVNPYFSLQPNQTSVEESNATSEFDTFLSGKDDINNIQQYVSWQGNTSVNVWATKEANMIKGTDATQFKPGLTKDDHPTIFVTNAFRSGDLQFGEEIEVEQIRLLRFGIGNDTMKNMTYVPANAAYYAYAPNGVINITSASSSAPVFLSKPHFLDADPCYREAVVGMAPNRTLHDINIDVEPITGKTMSAQKRLQVNVKVDPVVLLYQNITETYVPVVWIEEIATITPSLAAQFRAKVYTAKNVQKYSRLVGIPVGILFVMVSVVSIITIVRRNRRPSNDYLLIE